YSSHILTSAYPLVQANALANSVLGFQPGYRVVVGDLTSEYQEAQEEDFVVSWEDISVHPDYIDPKVETQGLVKNNLAIISLPSSITSSTSASYITIEVSKVTNDLTSYDVNVAGWDAVASAAVPVQAHTQDHVTVKMANPGGCSKTPACYTFMPGQGDVGTGVKTQGKKKLIGSLDILVAINQFSLCDENSKHYSFGSSMSYSSHFSFVCKQASMCLSYGKPGNPSYFFVVGIFAFVSFVWAVAAVIPGQATLLQQSLPGSHRMRTRRCKHNNMFRLKSVVLVPHGFVPHVGGPWGKESPYIRF
ncbi:unnamed protein product, partial [Notodromas monacha]